MVNWNAIGVMLQDSAERGIVHDAAINCGLEPVEVKNPDAELLFRSALSPDPFKSQQQINNEEHRWLPLIVADEHSPLSNWQTVLHGKSVWTSAIVMVKDRRLVPEDESVLSPDAGYAWVLERPLQIDSVKMQIQQAVRANRVFLGHYHEVIEDLYRSRTIFDAVMNGISLADATMPDLPLVYVNPAFERMTGYEASEVYGRNCRFLQGADLEQPGIDLMREALRARKPVQVLLRNYKKDGTLFWNEMNLAPILGLDGMVTHFVGVQSDVTERVEATAKLEQLAYFDALTGLAKRGLLVEQLKQALARAKRARNKLAVLLFDLQNFGQTNDQAGRAAGDELLKVIANRLRETARDHETVARLEPTSGMGGDEFVVVLEGLDDEVQHLEAIRRFCARLGEPVEFEGICIRPELSVGAALFPRDGYTVQMLRDAANADLRRAKKSLVHSELA